LYYTIYVVGWFASHNLDVPLLYLTPHTTITSLVDVLLWLVKGQTTGTALIAIITVMVAVTLLRVIGIACGHRREGAV